jgi:hypothetical protein
MGAKADTGGSPSTGGITEVSFKTDGTLTTSGEGATAAGLLEPQPMLQGAARGERCVSGCEATAVYTQQQIGENANIAAAAVHTRHATLVCLGATHTLITGNKANFRQGPREKCGTCKKNGCPARQAACAHEE